MSNEKLAKLYTTLTTPNESLGGKAFYTPDALGGSIDAFATKLQDSATLEKLYNALTTPNEVLGGKAFYAPDALGGSSLEFSNKIGIQKKNPIQNGSTNGSTHSQDSNISNPLVKINSSDAFNYTNPDYQKKVTEKEAKDKEAFNKGKQLVAPYQIRNKELDSITPSAVQTKRYGSISGDIAEIEDPQSYLSDPYISAAYNQIPSIVSKLIDKTPSQKLVLVKAIAEDPELRQKLTKYGSEMTQADFRKEIEGVLQAGAEKNNQRLKDLQSAGMQDKLNKASNITEALKVKLDQLKALDSHNNFIQNSISNNSGQKNIPDAIKGIKKEMDLYSESVIDINNINKNIASKNEEINTKYKEYKDPETGRFIIDNNTIVDQFNSDIASLTAMQDAYNQKISSPEYIKYTQDVDKYNELVAKQNALNEPIAKSIKEFNGNLKKREALVAEISGLSNSLKSFDSLNKDLTEYRKIANQNDEYQFIVGDKVLNGALLKRLPEEYSREYSKVDKEVAKIVSGDFLSPTTEFTGKLLNSTADMFYKMGGGALGVIGDINQSLGELTGTDNSKVYDWFDFASDRSQNFQKTYGIQYADRPALDSKTGDIIWSNLPYVAAESSGSLIANILIGAATGGSNAASIVLPTYLATIGDRTKEAKNLGLSETEASLYANGMAFVEGLSELIMPDYDMFKGVNKAGLVKFLKGNKDLSMQSFVNYVFKHGLVDIPKEILEEYTVNAAEILSKSAILLSEGKLNKDTFINTLGNPKDYIVTALSTALIPAGIKALTVSGQGNDMYNAVMYDASKNLSASQSALSQLVSDGHLTKEQADKANKDLVRFAAVNNLLPADVIAEKAVMITPILEEVQDLQIKHDASVVTPVKATYASRIKELNNKAENILSMPNNRFLTPSDLQGVKYELSNQEQLLAQKKELQDKIKGQVLEEAPVVDLVAPIDDVIVTDGKKLFSEPAPEVKSIADTYKKSKGINIDSGDNITELNIDQSKNIADAFDEMKHEPDNPEVKAAYEAMASETLDQFNDLEKNDYKVEVFDGDGEPYKNSQEMLKDLRDNKHLYILSTEKDFGQEPITDKQREENPLLRDSGKKDINGNPLLVNDVFRFVHDVFGHGERGNSFGAKGEENAWDVHARMFSSVARKAMTTETRGQNSWVNFGKHMRNADGSIKQKNDEGYLNPTKRPFAEQKIGLLPDFAYKLYFKEEEPKAPEIKKQPTQTLKKENNATEIKPEQKQRVSKQSSQPEHKGVEKKRNEAEVSTANRGDSNISSKKEAAQVPTSLTDLEVQYKNGSTLLTKSELKEILDIKRARKEKVLLALSKEGLSKDEITIKKEALLKVEDAIDDLIRRIDAQTDIVEDAKILENKVESLKEKKSILGDKITSYVKSVASESKKLGLSNIKSKEQILKQIEDDVEFFENLVDYAVVSIQLGVVKSVAQLNQVLKSDLGIDLFSDKNKPSKQLKMIYDEAKSKIVFNKPDNIKTVIKNSTSSLAGSEKFTITFKQWISDRAKQESRLEKEKAKAFAEGVKIGDNNRAEIINFTTQYLTDSGIDNLSKKKILSIINRAVKLKTIKNIFDFIEYVDYMVSKADYYASVQNAEDLRKSLQKQLRKEKFGQITPSVVDFLNIDPSILPQSSVEDYITLAKELLEKKVANVKSLSESLLSIRLAERNILENSVEVNILSESSMVESFDKIQELNQSINSDVLADDEIRGKKEEYDKAVKELMSTLSSKREEIEKYIPNKDGDIAISIDTPQQYIGLLSAIRTYNKSISEAFDMGLINEDKMESLFIDVNSPELGSLENSLSDILKAFKQSLLENTKAQAIEISSQMKSGGLSAELFQNLSEKDKNIYADVLDSLLDLDNSVYDDLSVKQLDDLNRAYEQVLNGYISPLLLSSMASLNVKSLINDLKANINDYIDSEVKSDKGIKSLFSGLIKSVGEYSWPDFAKVLKGLDYHQVDAYVKESGLGKIYQRYLYYPLNRQYAKYNNQSNRLIDRAKKIADSMPQIDRYIVGMFMIQADYMMFDKHKELPPEQKDLVSYLLSKHSNSTPITSDVNKLMMLQKAKDLLSLDITSFEDLEKSKARFFAKNKKAKALYGELRKNIDGELYSMSKINTESEGGYFEYQDNYTPIQRRGIKDSTIEDLDESIGMIRKSPNIKLRSNATYKRTGDPVVFREFDAFRMYEIQVEDVTKNFYIKPVYSQFLKAVYDTAGEYDLKGNKDVSIFLKASQDALKEAFKLRFNQLDNEKTIKGLRVVGTFGRRLSLANYFRPIKEFPSNIVKIITSITPNEYGDLFVSSSFGKLFNSKRYASVDVFDSIANMVGSSVALNTNSTNIEHQFGAYKARVSRIDKVQSMSDESAQRIAWKTRFLSSFRDVTKEDFNKDKYSENPLKYFRDNKKAMEKAVFEADMFIDKKFVTQSPIGRATTFKYTPFTKPYKRGGVGSTIFEYMNSYIIGDYRVFWGATKRLASDPSLKNTGAWVSDVMPIFASNLTYFMLAPIAQATAASAGVASAKLAEVILSKLTPGDDDDEKIADVWDELTSYNAEVFGDAMDEIYSYIYNKDGTIAYDNYVKILASMLMGKYALSAKLSYGLGSGLFVSADTESELSKKDKKSKFKGRQDDLSVANKYLEFKPLILVGSKANRSKITDASGIIPFAGIPINITATLFNPDDPSSVTSLISEVKKINKTGSVDEKALLMGTSQLALLTMSAFGYYMAPTAYRAAVSPAKIKSAKDYRNRVEKVKSTQPVNNIFKAPSMGGGFNNITGF